MENNPYTLKKTGIALIVSTIVTSVIAPLVGVAMTPALVGGTGLVESLEAGAIALYAGGVLGTMGYVAGTAFGAAIGGAVEKIVTAIKPSLADTMKKIALASTFIGSTLGPVAGVNGSLIGYDMARDKFLRNTCVMNFNNIAVDSPVAKGCAQMGIKIKPPQSGM